MAKKFLAKVTVLGQEVKVYTNDIDHDSHFETMNAYYNKGTSQIVIDSRITDQKFIEHLVYHELVHAFLKESGLDTQTENNWAAMEEVVDWIAFQAPKITKASEGVIKQIKKLKKDSKKKGGHKQWLRQ